MSHAAIIVALEDFAGDCNDLENAVSAQMAPFDEKGEWFRDGSRWDWWEIGGRYKKFLLGNEVCTRADLTLEKMEQFAEDKARNTWARYEPENPVMKSFYKMPKGATLESFIALKRRVKLSAFAFLREQRWHENERLGFFGGTAATECETAGRAKGKCIVGKIDEPPCIIGFNETPERWEDHYFARFIENLAPTTTLVVVDFHV